MKFLGNIKVATKVFAGSGLILVMLLVSSAVTVLGLLSVQANFTDYRGLARTTNAVSSVESELLYARLGVKDFILKGTKEAAAAVRERASAAKSALGTAATLSSDPEAKTVIQKADGQVAQYEGAFGEIVQLRAEQDALVAKLNDAGPQTEESLTAIMQIANRGADAVTTYKSGLALRYLLLARLYANRFLIENEQEQIDRVNSEMASLEQVTREIGSGNLVPEQRAQFDRLNAQAKIYRDTFAAIAQLVAKRNGIVSGQLDKIGPTVAKSLEDVKAENRKAQDELGPRATAEIEQSITIGAVASALALVLGIASAFVIGRGISRPVVAMTDAMRKLAEGDKTIEIPARENKDEIGQMAVAVQVFKENMIRAEQLAAEQEQERKARELRGQKIEQLTKDFDQTVSGVLDLLASATTELQSTAESMSATAEETSRQSTAVAAASEQATNNVQTVSTAAEELSSSIAEISRQVSQSNEIAGKAATEAAKTNVHVEGLATSAQKIGEVVALISEIADKTNLLALNATIEAARAGDAGKGFAVVASEVKTLATQTAKATEEISEQVGGIQSATGEAVAAIKGIAKIIEEMNEVATVIASAVEEQGAATGEISRNVQQAAAGTQEVSTNISGVSTAAGETGTAATQVQASAGQLAKQSDALKSSVEHFLREVRAA